MFIGWTAKQEELTSGYWDGKLAPGKWLRIFPDAKGMPASWDDPRVQWCKRNNVIPFFSWKTTNILGVKTWLEAMPDDIPEAYTTYWHEYENDHSSPAQYNARYESFWIIIEGLDPALRQKIKYGNIQTNLWTEDKRKGNFDYSTWDVKSGHGDFWGVDAYVGSWLSTPPSVEDFFKYIKAYKPTGNRKKMIVEFGMVSLPSDPGDTVRASWFDAAFTELETWPDLLGIIFWNTEGRSGAALPGLGVKRWFQVDRKGTGDDGSYRILDPASALYVLNQAIEKYNTPVEPPVDEYTRGWNDAIDEAIRVLTDLLKRA